MPFEQHVSWQQCLVKIYEFRNSPIVSNNPTYFTIFTQWSVATSSDVLVAYEEEMVFCKVIAKTYMAARIRFFLLCNKLKYLVSLTAWTSITHRIKLTYDLQNIFLGYGLCPDKIQVDEVN